MEKYEFLSRTGEGAYGSVWKARDKNTGILVAVKKMKDVPTSEEEGEIAMREVRVLQLAKHVNIVNLLEAYKSQSGRLYLVFEYVERTLLQELRANRCGMEPLVVKSLTWQLLQAIGYLHRKQIIHRDVKPSNILITEGGVVKICDFGFARACSSASTNPAYTTYVVTRWYRPPEVLVGDTYGPPVDIWALGCIFAEMLMGRPLFPGRNHHDQLWLIIKCLGRMTERQLELLDSDPQFACFRLPTQSEIEPLDLRLVGISPAAMQVLRACLDPDPKHRASAEELLAMPYFQGVTEALPLKELAAYPDSDMRGRLERAAAHDQAAAAAAAVREAALPLNGNRRVLGPPSKAQQQGLAAANNATAASSPRPALQQLPQQLQQVSGEQQVLPHKSATSSKLDPCSETQRPPLQRHITAPAGTIAARVVAQPSLLQPLTEHGATAQQRSRTGSESSQQSSPKGQGASTGSGAVGFAAVNGVGNSGPHPLVPSRGRSMWRFSGDGSAEPVGSSGLGSRPVCGVAVMVPQAANAPNLHHEAGGRVTLDGSGVTTRLPPQSRATWNGCVPRSQPACSNGGASTGGGGGGGGGAGAGGGGDRVSNGGSANGGTGGGGPPAGQQFLASSFNYHHTLPFDAVAVQRKAHSLAGNEGLPPASISAPMGIRGPSGLMGVQGRSLAPQLGPGAGSGSSSAPAAAGFQLPPSQFSMPPTTGGHRLNPSHLAGAYNPMLRGNSAAGPVPVPGPGPGHASQGRATQDGQGGGCPPPQTPGMVTAAAPPGPPAPLCLPPKQPSLGAVPPCMATHTAGLLDVEPSESSVADGVAVAHHNEGRRASDTVLYAMPTLREVKYRVSHLAAAASGRPHPGTVLDGAAVAPGGPCGHGHATAHITAHVGGSGGSSGGGAQGPGPIRVGMFTRGSASAGNGPPSPEAIAPPNLPPLQGCTPQRRVSAPEGAILTSLASGHSHGSLGGGGSNNSSRANSAVMHPAFGGGGGGGGASCGCFPQRAPLKPHQGYQPQGPQGHASSGSSGGGCLQQVQGGVEIDGADGSGGTHAFLPVLDVGAHGGKSAGRAANGASCLSLAVGIARRPSKGTLRGAGSDTTCKREEMTKGVLLEAVPEASVL